MAGKGIIMMSMKELKRVPVIRNTINKQITQQEAANILGLCRRQIIRLVKKVKEKGDTALIHKSRGRHSNRAVPSDIKDRILTLCKTRYKDFNPTFAAEKLFEIDKIQIHCDTLRKWFIEAGIEYKKRKAPKHRSWRPRKGCFGQMIQIDGSHHRWFEGRGPECVLMGYVDDATGRIFGHFYDYEGTRPFMDSFKGYIKKYDIPQSVYIDMHTTYKSPKKPSIEDQLNNQKALTQVGRALTELGVDIIYAHSAPAKGRVERSFSTHQDRLVKELRLAGINNVKDANKFLHSYYIPKHNRKFAVIAKDKANLHRPVPKHINLDRVFSIKNKVALRKDFTIQYNNKFYQILESTRAKEVTVEEQLNGKLYIYHKDRQLKYKLIDKRPQRQRKIYRLKPRKVYRPPMDHPFKKPIFERYQHIHRYSQKEKSSKKEKELLLVR